MDSNKTPILVFLVACVSCVSGLKLPQPKNLQVNIMDGEVVVHWDKPVGAPSDSQYNVEFGRYTREWAPVSSCHKITKTVCNLSKLIQDYDTNYKVRVQLMAEGRYSEWTPKKKILPNSSQLQPPSFTLLATSTTLTVNVHQKDILRKLYPFGVIYTIYLEEKAQNKTTITYLKDDSWDHQRTKTFSSLRWGKEYCVTIKVEGSGALASSMSPQQCLVLPEQEWIITAVSSLTVLGVLTVTACMATFILCYIKRPMKTPAALKSPASGWRPLSVGEGTMEVVTDKGWFLSSYRAEMKHCVFKDLPSTYVTDPKGGEEDDRRPSTDSGVSMKSNPETTRQEDSGCESIGGQDSICSNYPIQDEGSHTHSTGKMDDSGVGLGCHSDSSSLNLEEQDSGCLNKTGDSYHNQHLSSIHNHVCDNEDIFKENPPESQLVSVVSGYRANTSFCTCSGVGRCIWCHNQGNYRGQYKGLLQNNCNIVDSYTKTLSYSTNAQIDSVIQLEETFPMLTALSSFPLMEVGRDYNMNDVSLSLCDVELNH